MTIRRLASVLLALAISLPAVLAIGITVPRFYKLDFVPGFEMTEHFYTFNSHDTRMFVDVSLGNDLATYSNASVATLDLVPLGVGEFDVHIKLPDSLPPGPHRVDITVKERPPTGGLMSASTAATV